MSTNFSNPEKIEAQIADCQSAMLSLREYLRRGCAAAIVGCGFSRNARRRDSKIAGPAEWKGFTNRFASELLGCNPNDIGKIGKYCEGKTPLVLSHEYESIFGRSAMIDIVKDLIHDENLVPDDVHESFLRLGWSDIYTTNYDTLLERTLSSMPEAAYRLVLNANQIVGSRERRIVKLHGTWDGPIADWIVTDEDYRKYPTRFAPFVNMVRQTCMESCLCLVGFSGTDPNFLSWIGWVRDNMGEAGYPIYLLHDRPLYQGEREWFVKRRIIPVDIFAFSDVERGNYTKAFKKLFEYLEQQPVSDSNPSSAGWNFFTTDAYKNEDSIVALRNWISQIHLYRENYSGRIVAPAEVRENIHRLSSAGVFERALLLVEQCFKTRERINAFSDLNWYLSLGFEIMSGASYRTNISFFENIRDLKDGDCLADDGDEVDLSRVVDVCTALLTASRELCDDNRFNEVEGYLRDKLHWDKNILYYEKFLLAKRDLDIELMEQVISEWSTLQKGAEWQVKYASALASLGRTNEARSLLISSIGEIRRNLPLGTTPIEMRFLSLEGVALYILLLLSGSKADEGHSSFTQKMIHARLSRLAAYDCDPREDIEKFKLMFTGRFEAPKKVNSERKFDRTLETWQFGGGLPDDCILSGVVSRYFEETGILFNVGSGSTFSKEWWNAFVQRYMYQYSASANSLDWIFATSIVDYNNNVLNEVALCRMSKDVAKAMLRKCIKRIRYIYAVFGNFSRLDLNGVYVRILKYSLEISSRLVSRVDDQHLIEQTLDCGLMLYRKYADRFGSAKDVGVDFFRRVESAMSAENVIKRLPDILSSIVSNEKGAIFDYERLSPLTALTYVQVVNKVSKVDVKLQRVISYTLNSLDDPSIDDLILKDNLTKLCHCEHLGLLTSSQVVALANRVKSFLEEKNHVVANLALGYVSRLLSSLECRDSVVNLMVRDSIKSLPPNLSFSIQFNSVYDGIEQVFGAKSARSQSHCTMLDDTMRVLEEFIIGRFGKVIAALNDRSCSEFEETTCRDELHRLDMLCGDVMYTNKSGQADLYYQLTQKFPAQCDDRDLPLMYMLSHQKDNGFELNQFFDDYDVFEPSGRMNHLLQSFESLAHQIAKDDIRVQIVGDYLVELFVNTNNDYFTEVCNALSIWVSCFDDSDLLFAGRESSFCRVLEETEYDNTRRFPGDSVMDKRVAYAFLCGTIWGMLRGRRDIGNTKIATFLASWKNRIEAGEELARVRNSWLAGVNFGLNEDKCPEKGPQ